MSIASEPAHGDERIRMLDTARGVAVLGILLINILGFGLPRAGLDPTNWGGADGANLVAWRICSLFVEGTMRGLFTLLFGAGVLLFLQRHSARNSGLQPADLYFRRTMWLIAFGLVNGYVLLWVGDILYTYGVLGLLLFVFRNWSARKLIALAAVMMSLQTVVNVAEWRDYVNTSAAAETARAVQARGEHLTPEQQKSIDEATKKREEFKPPQESQRKRVATIQSGYLEAQRFIAPRTYALETVIFFRHLLFEGMGMMLLGMALLRLGVLTGAASRGAYLKMMLIGYALGLSVNLYEMSFVEAAAFDPEAILRSALTYDVGRIPMTLGHLGLIGLLCRTRAFESLVRTLAAVGQLALTNYLMHSVICMFLFTGAGFALYGELQRHELYYVVAAIWTVQLIASPLYLRHFRFGPAEWLWRSLTYRRRQSIRLRKLAPPADSERG